MNFSYKQLLNFANVTISNFEEIFYCLICINGNRYIDFDIKENRVHLDNLTGFKKYLLGNDDLIIKLKYSRKMPNANNSYTTIVNLKVKKVDQQKYSLMWQRIIPNQFKNCDYIKQHFLSVNYLKSFVYNSKSVWVYNKETKITEPANIIKNEYFKKNLLFTYDPSDSYTEKDFFGYYDNNYKEKITDINKNRYFLSEYLAMQLLRHPSKISKIRTQNNRWLVNNKLHGGINFMQYWDLSTYHTNQVNNIKDVYLYNHNKLGKSANDIYNSKWVVVKNDSNIKLLSSDHPIYQIFNKLIYIISPERFLVIFESFSGEFESCSESKDSYIDKINNYTISRAKYYLIAQNKSQLDMLSKAVVL